MTPGQLIPLAAPLLETILAGGMADGTLARFFKERGSGPRERAAVGDLVFTVLRHRRRLERLLTLAAPETHPGGPLELAAAATLPPDDASPVAALRALLALSPATTSDHHPHPATPEERCSLPDWLWRAFVARWGEEESLALGEALLQPAPTDLRVNRLRTTRERLAATLAAAGIDTTPLPFAPDGLRLTGNAPVTTLPPFHRGEFEIQDEGSQLISLLLAPRPGETVIDLCAGGGGKSLHLAALMRNQGRLIAVDADARRLGRLPPRARRAGVGIIQTRPVRHEGDPVLRPLAGKADAVLVDAPCSGSGTLRRRPELKWHLTPEQVETLHQRQCALLAAGARLTRPGGRLLYATCSLLMRENEAVAETFVNENPQFRLLDATRTLAAQGVQGLYCTSPHLALAPHRDGCDGFFAALFQRNR